MMNGNLEIENPMPKLGLAEDWDGGAWKIFRGKLAAYCGRWRGRRPKTIVEMTPWQRVLALSVERSETKGLLRKIALSVMGR